MIVHVLVPGLRDPPVLFLSNDECSELTLPCNGGTCMRPRGPSMYVRAGTGFGGPTYAKSKY